MILKGSSSWVDISDFLYSIGSSSNNFSIDLKTYPSSVSKNKKPKPFAEDVVFEHNHCIVSKGLF